MLVGGGRARLQSEEASETSEEPRRCCTVDQRWESPTFVKNEGRERERDVRGRGGEREMGASMRRKKKCLSRQLTYE
jgi:hypothetical protein